MKIKNTSKIVVSLILLLGSQAFACSFQAAGVTPTNASAVSKALQSITPEVDFDAKTGAIHFKSKAEVTQKQVDEALAKAAITDVKISTASKHK